MIKKLTILSIFIIVKLILLMGEVSSVRYTLIQHTLYERLTDLWIVYGTMDLECMSL